MTMRVCITAVFLLPVFALARDLTASVSYGACFLTGAPNAYSPYDFKPPAKTNEPLGAEISLSLGPVSLAGAYAQRYELYSDIGKVHDFELAARVPFFTRDRWALNAVAGVGFARAPVPLAFFFGEPEGGGFTYDWTPLAGVSFESRFWEPMAVTAAVSYRERLQVIKFFELVEPYAGTVKSPSLNFSARALYYPWRWLGVGPTVEQVLYGPYDYYLYSQTNLNTGWVTANELYLYGTLAFALP